MSTVDGSRFCLSSTTIRPRDQPSPENAAATLHSHPWPPSHSAKNVVSRALQSEAKWHRRSMTERATFSGNTSGSHEADDRSHAVAELMPDHAPPKSDGRVQRSDQEDLMRNDKVRDGQIGAPRRSRNRGAGWRWQYMDHVNQQRLKVEIGNAYLLRHPGQNGHSDNRRAAMLRPRRARAAVRGAMTTAAPDIRSRN